MINSSSDSVKKLNSINRRMFLTGSLKFFIMIGLVSRLFFLQIKENKKYLTLSDKNRLDINFNQAQVESILPEHFLEQVTCCSVETH